MKLADKLFTLECRLPKVFNGGSEYEWYQPMKPGDIITTRAKLAGLYEKQRKNGTLLFFIIETSFTNQRGEPVARGRHTFIRM
jgi:acyl dehydratase